MTESFDLAIVGAGPAGMAAAITNINIKISAASRAEGDVAAVGRPSGLNIITQSQG